ncbi:hypothetical protein MESS4_120252 [Mesorhizobium sp. STM 4661]|nr:hypothetical protein MESS4_120252 [Mesorhizobium sp. STM 4661]
MLPSCREFNFSPPSPPITGRSAIVLQGIRRCAIVYHESNCLHPSGLVDGASALSTLLRANDISEWTDEDSAPADTADNKFDGLSPGANPLWGSKEGFLHDAESGFLGHGRNAGRQRAAA